MSLMLLAPWALFGAILLAIPVIIHLFKPRRVRQTPFSSLRWLQLSPQKLSRRIQWHQVLLFLLRAAFIALLVLALARPLMSTGESKGFRDRFIVLDVSHSMSYRSAGQVPPLERAKELAAELLRRNRPGDRTAILLTGVQTRLLTPLSSEPESYFSALKDVQARLTGTDLSSALPVVRGLLGKPRPGSSAEVWFLTDNQQQAWRQGPPATFLDGLSVPVTVRVVDVGVAGPQNAWITRARLLEFGKPTRRVLRVELGCVGDTVQERSLHLDAAAGMPARSQRIELTPGRTAIVDLDVPASATLDSGRLRFHVEPSDGLPADDEFLLNLDAQGALPVLIVEGPAAGAVPHSTGHHLRIALEALQDAGQPLNPRSVSAAEARPADFRGAEVVFLADVPELPDDALTALEERVRAGVGLAIMLGGAGKSQFLNERLCKSLQPAEGLLPAPVRAVEENENRLAPLTGVQWTHPLLSGLNDPKIGDLGQVRFRRWHEFTAPLDDRASILARIDEGAPALLERTLGAGRIVVLNTGAGDRWSNMPLRNSFIPFVDRLLSHLSATGSLRIYSVGDIVTLPLPGWQAGELVTVVSPTGHRLTPLIRDNGGRSVLAFEVTEAGAHRIERGSESFFVAVQASRGDSVLAPMDATTLQLWWTPAGCEVIRADDLADYLDATGGGRSLWPWLLLLAGLVLLGEFYLVHRVCPRANPKLVQNMVAPRSRSVTQS